MDSPATIDRVSPGLEPDAQELMHQNWHHLLFLHWEVPPADLQRLLPLGLDLDTYEGKAYVGLVPFTLTGVRPILLPPLPGVSSFHEINVRTYVHQQGRNPGVWFFSLDASSTLAVGAARMTYHLPYFHSRIDFAATPGGVPQLSFESHRDDPQGQTPAHAHLRYSPVEGLAAPAAVGTLEHFLLERYILYAADEQHRLHRARVHHQPYPVQRAEVHELDETLVWAAGIHRSQDAPLRHYAREVNVKIYGPEPADRRNLIRPHSPRPASASGSISGTCPEADLFCPILRCRPRVPARPIPCFARTKSGSACTIRCSSICPSGSGSTPAI